MKVLVMELQKRNTIGMRLLGFDVLGKLNPAHQGPIFTPVDQIKTDFEPLLIELNVPENTKLQIL